jgi:hypothetical protein
VPVEGGEVPQRDADEDIVIALGNGFAGHRLRLARGGGTTAP